MAKRRNDMGSFDEGSDCLKADPMRANGQVNKVRL
jgi:hypothetical protein